MADKDDPNRPDPYRPGATEAGVPAEARDASGGARDGRAPQPVSMGGQRLEGVPPAHATESPSSGAHSAVEAPSTNRGRTLLIGAVVAVIVIALAIWLLGVGAEEVEATALTIEGTLAA